MSCFKYVMPYQETNQENKRRIFGDNSISFMLKQQQQQQQQNTTMKTLSIILSFINSINVRFTFIFFIIKQMTKN